ncbi:MAG: ferredoxin [Vicinamibacteria bacterium]|nr:ferredoxin [Vicinamibacteria bacterium]
MTFDFDDPKYYDTLAVEKELERVTELCDGCRRCYRLCTPFDFMLDDCVDKNDGDISKITSADYRKMVDLCWQCKLCYNHCPYTPPHKWSIDFPRLMLRAKAARARAEGVTLQDRALGDVDLVGAIGCATAPLSNWANSFAPHRAVMEKVLGIEKSRRLPTFHRRTFASWMTARGTRPATPRTSVTLFYSCSVNYNEPQVGRDVVSVLEKNDCLVRCPEQVCCGMPFLDGGDVEAARKNARKNVESLKGAAERGEKIVVPQPTCSYVLKHEYPLLVPGDDAKKVAGATMDIFEYLASRKAEGTLNTDFPGKAPGRVAYQMPCHLRAQNMGFKTRDVLQTVPGTTVNVIEKCTAMDGTWGMKKEYFPISMQFAKKAADAMREGQPDVFSTDCSLSALQIEEASGRKPVHPIALLREAYGLPEER